MASSEKKNHENLGKYFTERKDPPHFPEEKRIIKIVVLSREEIRSFFTPHYDTVQGK